MRIRRFKRAASIIASASRRVSATGVSQKTCFPSAKAETTSGRWRPLGVVTSMASIDSSLRIFCGSVNQGALTRFASARAFGAERLTIPAISTCSFFPNAAYALAWVAPIPPAPKTASLIDSQWHPRVRGHKHSGQVPERDGSQGGFSLLLTSGAQAGYLALYGEFVITLRPGPHSFG